MSSEFDQDGLISIFALEASDGLTALWRALHPADGSLPTAESLRTQFILAHRVKGAAYQYGFTEIAELGEELETTLERLDEETEPDWDGTVTHLRDLVHRMRIKVEDLWTTEPQGMSASSSPASPHPAGVPETQADAAFSQASLSDDYLMPNLDEEVMEYFAPEAQEYLDAMEAALLRLEQDPRDGDTIQTLFRTAHTLKGSAYTVGFEVIGDVAHPLEDLMGAIRDGRLEFGTDRLDLLFQAVDVMRLLLHRERARLEQMRENVPALLEALRAGAGADAAPPSNEIDRTRDAYVLPIVDADTRTVFLQTAEASLAAMESALHSLSAGAVTPDTIHAFIQASQALRERARGIGLHALVESTGHLETIVTQLGAGHARLTTELYDLLSRAIEIQRTAVRLDPGRLDTVRAAFVPLLEELHATSRLEVPESEEIHSQTQPPPPAAESHSVRQGQPVPGTDESTVVRVSHERLERLLNLVGELVIGRGRLDQRLKALELLSQQVMTYRQRMLDTVRTFENKYEFTLPTKGAGQEEWEGLEIPALADFGALEFDKYDDFNILARRIAEVTADVNESMSQLNASIRQAREDMTQLQGLTTTMRDEIAHARMVPIGTPFLRFRRAVRELARAAGKEVTLITSGDQTEVDTTIVDKLVDPLIHMVRNAVYHGIEPPEVRVAKGKPSVGLISLRAAHHGNRVLIEVEDDGAGLDVDKIKARAVAMGLIEQRTAGEMTREEIINLVYLPNMSTAESVGQTAGRGIGMDVVKRTVESLNGHIEVESEPGRGTTFILELPLTLLVSTALLVRVADQRYAIPLPSVREVVIPVPGELQTIGGRSILQLPNETLEVEFLRTALHDEPVLSHEALPIVVARTPSGPVGLVVDELLGRQEIVIKGLGTLKPLRQSCFGGATIDPEGRVVLVLDVARFTVRPGLEHDPVSASHHPLLSAGGAGGGAEAEEASAANIPILLIDDSLSIRKFVGRMLEAAGYRVDTAVDGEDGLRKVAAHRYSLIITDLEMPKVNGYEVLQALRTRAATRAIPVLVMTTRAGEKHRHVALNMGASSYVTKPVEERALIAEVSRWMRQEAGATQ